jgi:hypothetical protein
VILHSLRERALLVAPIRLGFGVLWVFGARLSGATATTSLLAFAGGAFVTAFALLNDPRSRFFRRSEPVEAPPEARVATRWQQTLQATMPSTVGVSILAAIALRRLAQRPRLPPPAGLTRLLRGCRLEAADG